MELKRIKVGPRSRSKTIAKTHKNTITGAMNKPFFRWNRETEAYEFCLEFFNENAGETYIVVGTQLEWEWITKILAEVIAETPI